MAPLAFASLAVPRHPVPECAGRREHWLEVDARAKREWAMAPFNQPMGLRLPCAAARLYVGQGHHSHRLPIGKWACPFTPGVNCSTDDWMNLYAEHIMTHLASNLPQLAGTTLVCDCPMTVPCEADVLAGLVFEQTRPHEGPHPQASGVTRRRRGGAGP